MIHILAMFITIVLMSLLNSMREQFQIPSELYAMYDLKMSEDIKSFVDIPSITKHKNAPFVLTDHVSYMLLPQLNTEYQIVRHSDEKSYMYLMSRTKLTLPSIEENSIVGCTRASDMIFVDMISTCAGKKFVPLNAESDHMFIHSQTEYKLYKSRGYNVIDLLSMDKNILQVVGERVTTLEYHAESGKATLASHVVLLMKNILTENFANKTRKEIFLQDTPFEVVSLLPKTISVRNAKLAKGQKAVMFNQQKRNVSGVYYVTDVVDGVAILSQAITLENAEVEVIDQIVYGKTSQELYKDDLVFVKSLECFAVVASVSNQEFQANLTSCATIEKNRQYFPDDFVCFENPEIYNEEMCEALGSVMSRKCVYDSECPYFSSTLRGGCVNGVCEMPIGVESKSFVMPRTETKPLCLNCKDGKGDCCGLPGKKYAFYD